jgi:hypothetical protein
MAGTSVEFSEDVRKWLEAKKQLYPKKTLKAAVTGIIEAEMKKDLALNNVTAPEKKEDTPPSSSIPEQKTE